MTYFTAQLWREMNQEDYDMSERAHNQWIENSLKYQEYFQTIKRRIPKRILSKLDSTGGFHDLVIGDVSVQHDGNQYICRVDLVNGDERFSLEMTGIVNVKIDIVSFQQCVLGELRWGYHEFSITETNTLKLSVLCDIDNEFSFEFNGIALKSR